MLVDQVKYIQVEGRSYVDDRFRFRIGVRRSEFCFALFGVPVSSIIHHPITVITISCFNVQNIRHSPSDYGLATALRRRLLASTTQRFDLASSMSAKCLNCLRYPSISNTTL